MSRAASQPRFRRYAKAAASVVLLMLIAAACSSDGFPESYADQVDPETGLSNVQQNWLDGCTVGLGDSDLAQDANTVCECSYNAISASPAEGGIPFEDFVELDDDLKGDPTSLNKDEESLNDNETKLVNIVKACIAGG